MFIKNIYEGATYFHETNEIWYLFVVLMKEKDFYFDTFAHQQSLLDHLYFHHQPLRARAQNLHLF